MLLRLDLFGDQIAVLIYCFCIGEFVSSVHFQLYCDIWVFEASLQYVTGNITRCTVQQSANSFTVHTVESYLFC